ncbi:GDSL-type esterase/lipase family protein [Parablautia muri]|uniref:SGNH hydrolase-type esterase domain-containing protein n=1 Tax=Parablautia muri TaxID=2320879 RepID=A0A9X5BEM4_9FIRM|nr:GDSL-type esterase/lipase family protein [Parablautia muri]NBJ92406.1 hypothetical protein [Parablautia muri]
MKLIKKCPVFVLLLSTGLLFTLIALGGKNTIYASQEYDPITTPLLSVMFTAANDEIYPWQMFLNQNTPVMAQGPDTDKMNPEETDSDGQGEIQENTSSGDADGIGEESETEAGEASDALDEGEKPEEKAQENTANMGLGAGAVGADALRSASESLKEEASFERLPPLRESTHEEYINHVSADIYGDAGVIRAASYPFGTVDDSYFDDALFIGDSRLVGLKEYTDLSEHADFCCETSLTIYKALEEKFSDIGTVPEALENKDYTKIYMMLGINELGRGTTEDFMAKYTEVVDTLRELEPDAKIIIMGIMHVSGQKSSSDAIFNNGNINARNNAIATLADNKNIFYIDVNEVVCDEEGNLNEEYTFDQIHLLGARNDLVKQFLLEHGVTE